LAIFTRKRIALKYFLRTYYGRLRITTDGYGRYVRSTDHYGQLQTYYGRLRTYYGWLRMATDGYNTDGYARQPVFWYRAVQCIL